MPFFHHKQEYEIAEEEMDLARMHPGIKAFLLWTITAAAILLGCTSFSLTSQKIRNGSTVPADYQGKPIEITGLVYDAERGGYPVSLKTGSFSGDMILSINNHSLSIMQDGVIIHQADSPRENQYVTTVPLNDGHNGVLEFLVLSRKPDPHPGILSFSGTHVPCLFLGERTLTDRLIRVVSEIQLVLLGIYSAMTLILLLLFIQKPAERYLLHAAITAIAQIAMTMSLMNTELIRIPYNLYRHFISIQYIAPLSLTAYICIRKTRSALPPIVSRYTGARVFVLFTAACILIQEGFHVNMYNLLRRLLILPVIITHAYAFKAGKRGSSAMLVTYAVSDGIALYLYLIGVRSGIPYSLLGMYLRPTLFMYIPFLLCCLIQSLHIFTQHFSQAEFTSEQKEQLNQQLEILVSQRTNELRREQQRRHNMMQQIFHDLRSPIFVIKASLSQFPQTDPSLAGKLSIITSRVSYLERLTENLFISAKMDDNELMYDQDYVFLADLIRNILQALSVPANEKQVTLTYSCDENCITWGDELRIQQALLNIIDNAIVYTMPGGHVDICMTAADEQIYISVSDNGIGISKDDLDMIFERYHHSTRRKQSSGLGLYIARSIIQAHGGQIDVRSVIDQGSTFTVTLPLCPLEDEEGFP